MRKNTKGIITSVALIVIIIAIVIVYFVVKNNNKPELPSYNPEVASQAGMTQAGQGSETPAVNVNEKDIKVLKEYHYRSDNDYKLVLVLENISKADAGVAVVGKVRDAKKMVIGTEREVLFIDPGATTVVEISFDDKANEIVEAKYRISASNSSKIQPGLKSISYDTKQKGNRITITSKNNGNSDLSSVKANVLFFKDGKLIEVESEDMVEESGLFMKGSTVTKDIDCDVNYDNYQVYFSQVYDD